MLTQALSILLKSIREYRFEHTVSEAITGIDIVKAQIRIAEGICYRER